MSDLIEVTQADKEWAAYALNWDSAEQVLSGDKCEQKRHADLAISVSQYRAQAITDLSTKPDNTTGERVNQEGISSDGAVVIDLEKEFWNSLVEAANSSNWIPPEYFMNDWVSDCRDLLKNGPAALSPPSPDREAVIRECIEVTRGELLGEMDWECLLYDNGVESVILMLESLLDKD